MNAEQLKTRVIELKQKHPRWTVRDIQTQLEYEGLKVPTRPTLNGWIRTIKPQRRDG